MKLKFTTAVFLILFFYACTKDSQKPVVNKPFGCDSLSFSYDGQVKLIIETYCTGPTCHSGGNANYDFTTYHVVASRIRAGTFEERILLPSDDALHMPPMRVLDKCDLFTLREWIHQGYKK